ncbi:cytochrome c, partial [uncultured Paraglaciecola sp.]|uniref:c-type cytochrome n=1 Tax=uncultured Paraglaciecola sp. TaxID=1765024 RepID=UPI0025D6B6C6
MSTVSKVFTTTLLLLLASYSHAESDHQSLGKPAEALSQQTQWNLSIAPDGKALPKGKGFAAQGQQIFALKCAVCHGPEAIGASADPLVGEVGSLTSDYPEKTVNSYWPYATTLFDYIRRSMPINAPFSLTPDEVYALSAYILSQDAIIAEDFELNEETLPRVTMPNRDG